MAPSPKFWKGFKSVLLLLIIVGAVVALLFFMLMPDNRGTFLGIGTLILVLNLGLMFLFIKANDRKRPNHQDRGVDKRFDFHNRD
ncbi:MAG: hypothetical protein Q4E10_00470 [Porphyromonas sp.]|nr:hypothetical protein [Porphyromonas sp.]